MTGVQTCALPIWGVDVLTGKQQREHRDIDIDFDAQHTQKLYKN